MILQINFTLDAPVAEYHNMVDSVAQAFVDVPGLRWKIWLLNPTAQEAGGIYLFESQAFADEYLNGPLVARLRGLTFVRNISIKQFDVMPQPTALTRGPVQQALASEA
jgi:hypothetical protein